MRVFVAGATGVLGRASIPAMITAGHDVVAASRSEVNDATIKEMGAAPAQTDLFDPASIARAASGCEAICHLATKIPPLMKIRSARSWDENNRIRREGTKNLVAAGISAGAKVFVAESITFIYGDRGDAWVDESATTSSAWGPALDSTLDLEREARRFAESGDDRRAVILRFGLFYGPQAASTRDSARMARRRMLPVLGKGDNYFSNIHVDDAGRAVAAALDAAGGVYNVVEDEPVTQREYADAFSSAIGAPRAIGVPRWLGRLFIGGPANYVFASTRVSNRKFKEATGWSPQYPNVRQGFNQVAEKLDGGDL
ncbi:MAG TPA: NAD-dependent epimerase/dehydratase family protein [Dehalococcoidia bacterium]|nr:NAD-dependent epimerase/dehydratase family protein [Dehalococcoidia bacterium]